MSEPWPISAAGDMMATVSSVEIVTQGLSATSLRAAEPARRPDVTVKVNPAAPIIRARRLTSVFWIAMVMAQASCAARWMARTMRG